MEIRLLDPERDADDVVRIVRETNRFQLTDRVEWLRREAAMPERLQLLHLVAEDGGRVVGESWASYGLFAREQNVHLGVRVLRDRRRRGIGTELYERALEHALALDASDVLAQFDENDAGVAFAAARGFAASRAEVWSVLDTRAVREEPDPSIVLVPAAELDPRELHRVDEEATRDVPSHVQVAEIPYEDWLNFVWRHPFFTAEGSFGAVVDGEVAAVVFLVADPSVGRGVNLFTGTLRRFRGRGLARAAKLASARWAAEHGIAQIATANDETNQPMLAVNRRLGYRPALRRVEFLAERERLAGERGKHL